MGIERGAWRENIGCFWKRCTPNSIQWLHALTFDSSPKSSSLVDLAGREPLEGRLAEQPGKRPRERPGKRPNDYAVYRTLFIDLCGLWQRLAGASEFVVSLTVRLHTPNSTSRAEFRVESNAETVDNVRWMAKDRTHVTLWAVVLFTFLALFVNYKNRRMYQQHFIAKESSAVNL